MNGPRNPVRFQGAGFTLLEMIISLTILSLVLLTVYMAFSMGVDVWERMDQETSPEHRRAITLRLLQEDLASIRPYTWHGEDGDFSFFSGGPQTVFYVTTNALGAAKMQGKALFFTCLFMHASSEHGRSLYIYKTGLPHPEILEEVREFRAGGDTHRKQYALPSSLREESILLLEDLEEAEFAYQGQAYPPFSGAKADVESNGQRAGQDIGLAKAEWVENSLPGQVLVRLQKGEDSLLVHTVLAEEAALNR